MKFVLATGGTGGHVFPAIKVGEVLYRRGDEAIFVGSFGHQKASINLNRYAVYDHGASGLNFGKPLSAIRSFLLMFIAVIKSYFFLWKIKPDAVAGFGGYGGFPVTLAALLKGIPVMIHEQNVVPGRANSILGKLVKRIAVSFKESARYFPEAKVVHTGLPCNAKPNILDKDKILSRFHLLNSRRTILILGGSQGSRKINDVVSHIIGPLSKEIPVQVIHCCGKPDVDRLHHNYASLAIPFAVFDFLKDIEQAYAIADLIIARAGAATVMEVAASGVPTIFIPYPHAGGHQYYNAEVLQKLGKADIIHEKDLTINVLIETAQKMLTLNANKSPASGVFIPSAEEKIVHSLVELVK